MIDVLVIGGGPAGVVAALRAADAGAKTTLVTRDAFGVMTLTMDQCRCARSLTPRV